jgi:hypothetical protein
MATNSLGKKICMQLAKSFACAQGAHNLFFHCPSFALCYHQTPHGILSCSQFVPHVFAMFPNTFPITPFFYPLCFGKCCPLLTYIDGSKGRNTTLFYFGDYCMCTILLIGNFLFHITPTSKWNGNFLLKDSPNFGLS